jgi:hypothetical protein
VRGLNEHPHQIEFPLALRPALGIRVQHVEILIVAEDFSTPPLTVVIALTL